MKRVLAKKQLDEAIRVLKGALKTHGGDIEVVAAGQASVKVRLTGACLHCPMASLTFENAVRKYLLQKVDGLKKVTLAE